MDVKYDDEDTADAKADCNEDEKVDAKDGSDESEVLEATAPEGEGAVFDEPGTLAGGLNVGVKEAEYPAPVPCGPVDICAAELEIPLAGGPAAETSSELALLEI